MILSEAPPPSNLSANHFPSLPWISYHHPITSMLHGSLSALCLFIKKEAVKSPFAQSFLPFCSYTVSSYILIIKWAQSPNSQQWLFLLMKCDCAMQMWSNGHYPWFLRASLLQSLVPSTICLGWLVADWLDAMHLRWMRMWFWRNLLKFNTMHHFLSIKDFSRTLQEPFRNLYFKSVLQDKGSESRDSVKWERARVQEQAHLQMDTVWETWQECMRRAELTNGSKVAQGEKGKTARHPG